MNKAIRLLGIVIVLGVIIVLIGRVIYQVLCISCTIPPIKKYEYKGNINEFGEQLQIFCKTHPEVNYKITARDSANLNTNYRDIAIDIKKGQDSLIFGLTCEENITDGVWKTELDVVEAINSTKRTGGYGSTADGIKPLLDYFENNLLAELKKKQHAVIH